MGTRSLTHIKDENGKTLSTIYIQYDGYPSGVGDTYKELLGKSKLTNGFSLDQQVPEVFNGMGCLAAWLIGALKDNKIGHVYVYPPDSDGCGEDYTYTIYANKGGDLEMTCEGSSGEVYKGLISAFDGVTVEAKAEYA